jgi:hypothetical protein
MLRKTATASAARSAARKSGAAASKKTKGAASSMMGRARKALAGYTALKAAKSLAKMGALTGAAVGLDYAIHRSDGGAPLDRSDMKKIALDSGLNMMRRGMKGEASGKMVEEEIQKAARSRLRSKPKTGRSRQTLANRLRLIQRYLERRRKERHDFLNQGVVRKLKESRVFGTGAGGGGGKKSSRKRPKKKKPKKKPKKKKKKKKKPKKKRKPPKKRKKSAGFRKRTGGVGRRKGSRGLKPMNIAASRARFEKLRDVFDI